MADIKITLPMTEAEARDFSQLIKRLARSDLGQNGKSLVTPEEERGAETVLYRLRDALAAAGFDPR